MILLFCLLAIAKFPWFFVTFVKSLFYIWLNIWLFLLNPLYANINLFSSFGISPRQIVMVQGMFFCLTLCSFLFFGLVMCLILTIMIIVIITINVLSWWYPFSLLMLMFSISSLLMVDNSIMLLLTFFCILNGCFHGNLNLSPLILVGLGIHNTNSPSMAQPIGLDMFMVEHALL